MNIKQTLCLLLSLAMLLCAGCSQNPMHESGPHTRHPMVSDDEFTGVPLPTEAPLRPREEITQTTVTPEDVLAALDRWAQVSLHYYWQDSKERWGESFYDITATFRSICPGSFTDYDLSTSADEEPEPILRQFAYYVAEHGYDGTSYWQQEPVAYEERICALTVNIDLGLQGEIFEWCEFLDMGITESQFLPIAQGMGAEAFEITQEALMELYGLPGNYMATMMHHGSTAYPAFTLDRESILAMEDRDLLWALYTAIHGSLYSINLRDHYQTYGDLTFIP